MRLGAADLSGVEILSTSCEYPALRSCRKECIETIPARLQLEPKMQPKTSIEPKWPPTFFKTEPLPNRVQMGPREGQPGKRVTRERMRGESSMVALYTKKWPAWRQVGTLNRSKMVNRSIQKLMRNLMSFKMNFRYVFIRFWDGKWKQLGTQID